MGRTACTEPQCLYKGALYLTFYKDVLFEYRLFVLYRKYRIFAYFSTLKTYYYVMDASHNGCRLGIIEYRSNNEYSNARCR